MDPSVTDPDTREARVLAAIVFTDVVGFSKLAAQNEARVYVALQRDMGVMTNLCRAHGGQVLNTMGDGMLLYFSSAVDAMGCAVEIQRTLYNQSHTLPNVEILHHRIGVHLGDVIMNGDNIFGDGVNIAARLQTMALPDSVCFSHTVYEVIKNKLKIDAKYLGPRQLKNIGEPVRVWQVPPVGQAPPDLANPLPVVAPADISERHEGVRGIKAGLLVFASVALLSVLIFAFTRMKAPPPGPKSTDSGGLAKLRDKWESKMGGGDASKNPADPPASSPTDPGSNGPGSNDPAASKQQIVSQVEALRQTFQFDQIVTLLKKSGSVDPDDAAKLDTYQKLAALQSFVERSVGAATPGNSLAVPRLDDLGGTSEAAQVYTQNGVWTAMSSDTGMTVLSKPTALQYLEIASSAVNNPNLGNTPSSQLPGYLQLFGTEFNVSIPQ